VPITQPFGPASDSMREQYPYHVGDDLLHVGAVDLLAGWSGKVQRSDWSDLIGNVVEVLAGYTFESTPMSAGFGFGVAHLSDRSVSAGGAVDSRTILGHSGNTGSLVTGPNGGYHTHFTVFGFGSGNNRYLSEVLGLADSRDWQHGDGSVWSYGYEPNDRRFYDPLNAYGLWFRK